MRIASAAFADGGTVPEAYACDGRDGSPPLEFSGAPAGAASLALVVDDLDSKPAGFTHWLLWDMPPDVAGSAEGGVPAGATVGRNDYGKEAWGGPCPPSGTHRYRFRLVALDTRLDLPAGSGRPAFEAAISGHVIAEAVLTASYARSGR